MRKPICYITKCKKFYGFSVKMLVLHPTCKRWQTWKVCKKHISIIEIDKFRQDNLIDPRWTWTVSYGSKKEKNNIRPVIEIGEIKTILVKIDLI